MIAPLETTTDIDPRAALCATTAHVSPDMFFSDELADIATAKLLCAACPEMAPCLQGALERREPVGVWGGQLFDSGAIVTIKRRRGRPPKVARPEDTVPTIPVPVHLAELARTA